MAGLWQALSLRTKCHKLRSHISEVFCHHGMPLDIPYLLRCIVVYNIVMCCVSYTALSNICTAEAVSVDYFSTEIADNR